MKFEPLDFHACCRSIFWNVLTSEPYHPYLTNNFWTSHHTMLYKQQGKFLLLQTCGFCLYKVLLSLSPHRTNFRFSSESLSPRFKSYKTPKKLVFFYSLRNLFVNTKTNWISEYIKDNFLKRFYLFSLRETGREEEREGEKHQCVVASCVLPTEDQAHKPRHVPWLGIKPAAL